MASQAVLSVPGKTFLSGEYLALEGGTALLFGSAPRFNLKITRSNGGAGNGRIFSADAMSFHPKSPAGLLYKDNQKYLDQFHLEFVDPYQVGGFGASTAQFVLLKAFVDLQDSVWVEGEYHWDWNQWLKSYREYCAKSGATASGADLIGQVRGGLTLFERNHGRIQNFGWPFPELGLCLFSTGVKLKTHEHLKAVKQIPVGDLASPMQLIEAGLIQSDPVQFINGIEAFTEILEQHGFQAPHILSLKNKASEIPGIWYSRGCGAMGSDVFAVFFDREKISSEKIEAAFPELNLVATEADIETGIRIDHGVI